VVDVPHGADGTHVGASEGASGVMPILISSGIGVIFGLLAGVATFKAAPTASAWATGISAGAYAATLVAVLWYSLETQAMRRAIVRQTEMSVRPFLVAGIEARPLNPLATLTAYEDLLVIRNIGSGPALFVRIETLHLEHLEVRFEVVDVIPGGHDAIVRARVFVDRAPLGGQANEFVASLKPSSASATLFLTLRYTDVDGGGHWSKMKMGQGGNCVSHHSAEKSLS